MSALSLVNNVVNNNNFISLPTKVASILRKFGSDAHLYMPGPGVPILGPELLANGGLDADTAWGKDQATISGGVASINNVGAGVGVLQQGGLPLVTGRTYLCSFSVNSITTSGGGLSLRIGGSDSAVVSSPGAYSFPVVYDGISAVFMVRTRFAAVTAQFDNLSIKEILGYTNYLNGFAAGNYLESTGNTNASVDSAVGLVLDAAGSVGADKTPAGTVWSGYNANLSSATLPATATSTAAVNYGIRLSTLTVGKTYRAKVSWSGNNSGRQIKTDAAGLTTLGNAVSGSGTVVFTATDPYHYIYVTGTGAVGESFTINSVETCEITGTNATQATTANKPTLRRGIVNLQPYANVSSGLSSVPYGGGSSGAASTPVVTPNYAADQFGGNTACRVQFNLNGGTTTGDRAYLTGQPIAIDNVVRTSAVWVKANSGTATILTRINGTSAYVTVDTSEWKLLVVSGSSSGDSTNNLVEIRGGQTPTNSNTADLLVATHGIFQGALTAQQIIAAGGIPLTTTAPASSSAGAYAWELKDNSKFLPLQGPLFQMGDDQCFVCAARLPDVTGVSAIFDQRNTSTITPIVGKLHISGGSIQGVWRDNVGATLEVASGPEPVINNELFVASYRKVGNVKIARKNGVAGAANTTALGAATIQTATIGASVSTSTSQYANGLLYPIIAIKGTVSDYELRVLEKWLGSIAGVSIA